MLALPKSNQNRVDQRSKPCLIDWPLRSFRNSVVWLGLDGGNLGEDGVNIDLLAAIGAFVQIALRVERGELLSECAADELIYGNALVARQTLGVLMNGIGKSNAQCAHGSADGISARSCVGVTTRTPKEDAPSKSGVLKVTR